MTTINRSTQAAWTYHNLTKHSFWSVRQNAHIFDWPNKPHDFKYYIDLAPIELPRDVPPLDFPALESIRASVADKETESLPTLIDLVQLLYYSAGITRKRSYSGGEILYRAASCTGALYEIELYVVCGGIAELEAGVYHFSPRDLSLRQLRKGDYRAFVSRATGDEPHVAAAPLIVISTGTYWRNSWKYQARTYRHFGWDNGTILANLFASCTALDLPYFLCMGFVDDEINQLLGLDTLREVAFSMVAIGRTSETHPPSPLVETIALRTLALSPREVDYPAMREMHSASFLVSADEVIEWREQGRAEGEWPSADYRWPVKEGSQVTAMSGRGLGDVILKRGSTRRFARSESLTFDEFSTLLERSLSGIHADFLSPFGMHLNSVYLIVNAVDGLEPGAYALREPLQLLKSGDFRGQAGYLGLEQDLPADASFTVFLMADLDRVLERFGNRGYRAVQLESGIIGGRMYLAAYAQGFGATGLTFYDDDVANFFSPDARGKSAIFHLAFGRSASRRMRMME